MDFLAEDWRSGLFVGRIDRGDGPCVILVQDGRVRDVTGNSPTVAGLLAQPDPGAVEGVDLGPAELLVCRDAWSAGDGPALLAPIDLQCVKAAGVTFAVSTMERVIEERARGDASVAEAIRARLGEAIGGDMRAVVPGSPQAAELKAALIADGLWSQYLEVAIGPDAEVFTKAPVLAAVGPGAEIGVRGDSSWNNPEPEVVLVVDPAGRAVGATLGNDVNLRDFEGRSALLLGKAKDNNASAALGPLVRLFDDGFTLDDVRQADVRLEVEGEDGFRLEGRSSMSQISRDPATLVAQTINLNHQYPDGLVLYLGTMFAPVEDRDTPGQGFTHKVGDRVRVSSPRLGVLENRVATCDQAPPWTFGVGALMQNLAARGLLGGAT